MDTTRASLLVRVKNKGDAEAWRQFDGIYRPMLMRFALARGLASNDAEDVVQHAMAAISEHIGQFDYDPSKGRFKSWLRTIAGNRIANLLGRDRRERPADSAVFRTEQNREETPEELFDRIWRAEHLRHCLAQIRREVESQTYDVFCALSLEGKSVEEVAAQFTIPPSVVHSTKFRMIRRLRDHMSELLGEGD